MKITPVQGIMTLPLTPTSGALQNNPSKIKMGSGGGMGLSGQEDNTAESTETDTTGTEITTAEAESGIPDTSVQAGAASEAREPLSPQLAALGIQRRAFQQERQAFEKEKAEMPSKLKNEIYSQLKTNALSVLQEAGVTYDQLTDEIVAQQRGVSPEVQALKAQIKTLEEGFDKKLSDRDAESEQAVLGQMRTTIDTLSLRDDFELIRSTNSQAEVVNRIHDHWKKTGQVLGEEEAMTAIENELLNGFLELQKTKKAQSKSVPPAPLQQAARSGIRTLTNKDSARPVLDRKARAIAAMQGTLKG